MRTHHSTRTFRLSCGCLRDFSSMTPGKQSEVLCAACRKPVKTLYTYPENTCGEEGFCTELGMRTFCTNEAGNHECVSGVHYDELARASFTVPGRLRASNDGNTGHC